MEKHIIKRHGKAEPFDEKKLYASVYASALNAHHDQERAEEIASVVLEKIYGYIGNKQIVSAHELHKEVTKLLKNIDKDVSLLYESFLDLC